MIISSNIEWALPQIDGTSNVREVHTDDTGKSYIFDYQADAGMDLDARLAARAGELNVELTMPAPEPLPESIP